MQIEVVLLDPEINSAVREYVENRLSSALGRLAHRIREVEVRVGDENGPRGGDDKFCVVDVHLHPSGYLRVKRKSDEIYGAVDSVAESVQKTVKRKLERERTAIRKTAAA